MVPHIQGNALWHLVEQSDAITKFILLFLFAMNIVCTTIFLYKLIVLRLKLREVRKAERLFKSICTPEELRLAVSQTADTWPGYFLHKSFEHTKTLMDRHPLNPTLTTKDMDMIQTIMGQTIDDMMHAEQAYTPVLSSCAAISPLIGLFGTVWGLVHAFIRISQRQSADISTVAPGIAEALITTLAGLCVAIPTLLMYQYVVVKTRTLEHNLLLLADKTTLIIQTFFGQEG